MPKFAEIFHVSGSKKSSDDLGTAKNFTPGEEEIIEDTIPRGEDLDKNIAELVKEVESGSKFPNIRSRRIQPSEELTTHVDSQHPLPSKEVMVHQDDVDSYKKNAFKKNTLDLTKVRKNIEEMKKPAEPEDLNEKNKAKKLAKMDQELAELENKERKLDEMSDAEIHEISNAMKVVAGENVGQVASEKSDIKGNEPEFGRRPVAVKKGLPLDDRRGEPREMKDLNKPIIKSRREYDPEIGAVLEDLNKLTESKHILDHHKAAELIKGLTSEQKKKVKEKVSPELEEKLKNIEAPEFGRKDRKSREPVHDPYREDKEAYDQIVASSNRKKAPRGYNKVEPIDSSKASDTSAPKDVIHLPYIETKASAPKDVIHLPYVESKIASEAKDSLTPEQKKEVANISDELKEEGVLEVASVLGFVNGLNNKKKGNDNPDNLPPGELEKIRHSSPEKVSAPAEEAKNDKEREKKNENFWQEAGGLLKNPEIQKQLLKTGISIPASIFGYKSLYDVPAYLTQRYAVRGNIMGIGKGKGLGGSVEELLDVSRQSRDGQGAEGHKEGSNPKSLEDSEVIKAIKDLDKRLAKTKEGSEKNSEQRSKIAKLLWENRREEKQTKETRQKELENILDNYTTTKVTGIQAAREALNTACVATGAFALRGLAYGGLAFFESYEKMRREEKIKALNKGPEAKAEKVGVAKVFLSGARETYEGLRGLKELRNLKGLTKKEKLQKSLQIGSAAIKSFGSIARFAGIAIGMGTGGRAYGASLDKVIDFFEHKDKLAVAGNNFIDNTDKYLKLVPGIGASLSDTLNHYGHAVTDSLSHHEALADAPDILPGASLYNPTAKFDFTAEPMQVSSMTGEEIPEAPFQGGKSVWQEGDKQLLARFGDKFAHLDKAAQEANVARLQNAIVADPEAFGLPKNVDFNRMQLADIENIKWNNAFNNVFENKEGLTEVVHSLDKTLAHPDENLVRFGGAVESSGPDLEVGSADRAAKYFDNEGMKMKLEEWSEKARKFYDPATGQIEKRKIFEELSAVRENIDRATGGTSSFGLDGDVNLKLANGETINIFDNHGAPLVDISKGSPSPETSPAPEELASSPHRPSLGYNPLDPHHEGAVEPGRYTVLDGNRFDTKDSRYAEKISHYMESKFKNFAKGPGFEEKVKFLSEQGRKYFNENISQTERNKALESINDLRQMVEKEYNYHVDIREGGNVIFSPIVGNGIEFPVEQIDKGVFRGVGDVADNSAAAEIHRPSLGYQAPTGHSTEDLAAQEVSSHSEPETEALPDVGNPRDIHEPITDADVAKALLRNAERPGNINGHNFRGVNIDLRHVKEISPQALKVWQNKPGIFNFHGLKNINQETYDILSRYKGKVLLNDEAVKQLEAFSQNKPEGAEWFKNKV